MPNYELNYILLTFNESPIYSNKVIGEVNHLNYSSVGTSIEIYLFLPAPHLRFAIASIPSFLPVFKIHLILYIEVPRIFAASVYVLHVFTKVV